MNYCVPHDVQAFWYLNSCLYQLSSTPIVVWPGARSVKTTLIQTLVYQLSSILIVVWPGARSCQNNSRTNSCLPTFINSHRCLTRSKESQNNFHTNSCRSTFINWHPCLTTSKDSRNTSHTKYTNSRLSKIFQKSRLSYKFASIPTLILIVRTRLLVACASTLVAKCAFAFFGKENIFLRMDFRKRKKYLCKHIEAFQTRLHIYIYGKR